MHPLSFQLHQETITTDTRTRATLFFANDFQLPTLSIISEIIAACFGPRALTFPVNDQLIYWVTIPNSLRALVGDTQFLPNAIFALNRTKCVKVKCECMRNSRKCKGCYRNWDRGLDFIQTITYTQALRFRSTSLLLFLYTEKCLPRKE